MNTKVRWGIEIFIGGIIIMAFIFYIVAKGDMKLLKDIIISYSEVTPDLGFSNEVAVFVLVICSFLQAFIIKIGVEYIPIWSKKIVEKID